MKLVSELRRRNVFRTAALYAVAAWLILQVGEVTFEPLHFPAWAMTLLVVLVIVGFPIAMVLAWFFDLTLHGIKKDTTPRCNPPRSLLPLRQNLQTVVRRSPCFPLTT